MPPESELRELVGEYFSPDAETTLQVVLEEGELALVRRPGVRMVLRPADEGSYNSALGVVRFIRDDSGRTTQISVAQARVYDLRFDRID
jgi:hypothetical protein